MKEDRFRDGEVSGDTITVKSTFGRGRAREL